MTNKKSGSKDNPVPEIQEAEIVKTAKESTVIEPAYVDSKIENVEDVRNNILKLLSMPAFHLNKQDREEAQKAIMQSFNSNSKQAEIDAMLQIIFMKAKDDDDFKSMIKILELRAEINGLKRTKTNTNILVDVDFFDPFGK